MVNFPIEHTALRLLEYMQVESTRGKRVFTLYRLLSWPEKGQRKERVRRMMEVFIRMGWVRETEEGYELTEEGKTACPWKGEYFMLCKQLRESAEGPEGEE